MILQTRLLPRSYGWIAIGFGAASQALGLLGLFGKVAFADVNPAVLALENLWLITVAVTLLLDRRSPEPQPVVAQRMVEPTTSTGRWTSTAASGQTPASSRGSL